MKPATFFQSPDIYHIYNLALFSWSSVPVYGLCKDSAGVQFTSCYSLSTSASLSTVVTASGTYTVAAKNSDYSFSSDSSCNLDEANGINHVFEEL